MSCLCRKKNEHVAPTTLLGRSSSWLALAWVNSGTFYCHCTAQPRKTLPAICSVQDLDIAKPNLKQSSSLPYFKVKHHRTFQQSIKFILQKNCTRMWCCLSELGEPAGDAAGWHHLPPHAQRPRPHHCKQKENFYLKYYKDQM